MIYEYNYSILGHNNVQMVMTSVSGHLLNLEFASSYRGWRQCSPLALFDAPVQSYCPDNYKDIKRTLEKEIRGCHGKWVIKVSYLSFRFFVRNNKRFTDVVTILDPFLTTALIIWTDGDREGENIGFEIISVCRAIKPNVAVHRAKFSEITQNAIRRACNNLVRPDEVRALI